MDRDQALETVLGQLRALCEVAHGRERAATFALRDDRLRVVLADAVDVVQPDAHCAALDRALRAADVHVAADMDHSDTMSDVYERYVKTSEDRDLVLKGARESMAIIRYLDELHPK